MDGLKIYQDYFRKKYELINDFLDQLNNNNNTIALWGAGLRGKAFLNVYDPHAKRIQYVFDTDQTKIGRQMPTGHRIVDYRSNNADVVFIANNTLEFRILYNLKQAGKHPKTVNIDNYILGDFQNIYLAKPDFTEVREQKLAAVVVLYNPEQQIVEHVLSYAKHVDKLFVYDNSPLPDTKIKDRLSELSQVEYISALENRGLSAAFNICFEKACDEGVDWLFTFDQDSQVTPDMISLMRQYVQSKACTDDIGIVAPTANELDFSDDRIMGENYITYFDRVIQSGALHRIDMMKKVGGFDEKLFIDEVDNEYCVRCRLNGYHIVKLNRAVLMHNKEDDNVESKFVEGKMIRIGKYSPDRYYYRYRNALYCYDKYKDSEPIYAMVCENCLRTLEVNVKYDTDQEKKYHAMEQAKRDYKNGKMGKRGR